MHRVILSLFALTTVTVPPPGAPLNELLRAANDAIRQKNLTGADALLTRGEERSTDPGLIAFNRGVMLFEAEEYREAEVNFLRCLEDQAIPAERRTQALYNRGVCLVRRGEGEKLLRVAISCFEQCLDAAPPDGPLALDARHNLELTKLLWNQARAKQASPPIPNDPPAEEQPAKPPETSAEDPGPEANGTPQANGSPMSVPTTPQPRPNATAETPSPQQTSGKGPLPVVRDDAAERQRLSPDDTNLLLDRAEARLRSARQRNEQMRAGPERPNVRDW